MNVEQHHTRPFVALTRKGRRLGPSIPLCRYHHKLLHRLFTNKELRAMSDEAGVTSLASVYAGKIARLYFFAIEEAEGFTFQPMKK